MGYELSRDVLRASQLVHELQASEAGLRESEARMSLAVDAADLGIWIRDLRRNEIWASDKWRELFGFAPSEQLDFERHPAAGAPRRSRSPPAGARDGGRGVRMEADTRPEYRLILPDGATRWISSQRPCRVRRHRPAGPDPWRRPRRHRAQTRRAGDAAAAARDRARGARLDDGPARVGAGARDQSAARVDPAQRRGGGAVPAARLAGSRRDPRDSCGHPQDDERAGHVIDRMRGLLKQQTLEHGDGSTWARSSAMWRRWCGSMQRRGR